MENIHIGIVGGGPGGLISLYECSLRNIKATLYERESDFGGVWNFNSKLKRAHKSTVFDTSSITSSFNVDFTLFQFLKDKYPGQEIDFASSEDYYEYQHAFVERYQLSEMIVYNTEIVEILSGENELEFVLKSHDVLTKEDKEFVHDYVIISTGLYSNPITPDHPFLSNQLTMNVDNVWHTSHWDPLNFDSVTWDVMSRENVRILVIGSGQSAGEAMCDTLVRIKNKNYQQNIEIFWAPTRQPEKRSVWMIDRYPYGKSKVPIAIDAMFCRLFLHIPAWLVAKQWKKICKPVSLHERNAIPDIKRDRLCVCETEIIEIAMKNEIIKVLRDPILTIYKAESNQLMFDTKSLNSIPIDAAVIGSGYSYNELKINGEFIFNDRELYKDIILVNKSCLGRIGVIGATKKIGSSFPVCQMEIWWLLHQWFSNPRNLAQKLTALRETKSEKPIDYKRITGTILDDLAIDMHLTPNIWRNFASPHTRQRHLGISYLIGPWSIFQYAKPNETEAEQTTREDFAILTTEKTFEKSGKDFKFISSITDILYYFSMCSMASGFYLYGFPLLSRIGDILGFYCNELI